MSPAAPNTPLKQGVNVRRRAVKITPLKQGVNESRRGALIASLKQGVNEISAASGFFFIFSFAFIRG